MYDSIQGVLKRKEPARVVVETHGIGYRLAIPLSTYAALPEMGSSVCLYLCQVVREDAHMLYGFSSSEERDLFETLISLSGIGPKTALAIIGHMEMGLFQRAIAAADFRVLSKIPGVGKKTAERLVVEMRDKLKPSSPIQGNISLPSAGSLFSDALSALLNLGYHPVEAQKAVKTVFEEYRSETDLGRLITLALQRI